MLAIGTVRFRINAQYAIRITFECNTVHTCHQVKMFIIDAAVTYPWVGLTDLFWEEYPMIYNRTRGIAVRTQQDF